MCRAASHSPEVAIILLETCLPTPPDCKKGPSPAEVQRQQLIRLRAAEAANRAAGLSLQAFYGLAEARLQRDLVATSLAKIDEAIADLDSFRDQGIAVDVNRDQLILQRNALLQKAGGSGDGDCQCQQFPQAPPGRVSGVRSAIRSANRRPGAAVD